MRKKEYNSRKIGVGRIVLDSKDRPVVLPFNEQGFYAIVDLFAVGFVRDKTRVFCIPNIRFLEKLVFPTLRRLRRS